MAQVQFEQVLEDVKALTLAEQQQLRAWLDTICAPTPAPMTEEAFAHELREAGLLSEVKPPMTDPRAHLRKKLRFHRGKNRSSSSPGYVEENDRIFPSIRWELTRLSGFLPHRLPFHARDTADALSQKDLFIQVLGQTVMLCSNAHAGP